MTDPGGGAVEDDFRDAAVVGLGLIGGSVARDLLDDFSVDAPVRLLGVGLSGLQHDQLEDSLALDVEA